MKNVVTELNIPIQVTEDWIEIAQGGVVFLITPVKVTVLQVNLFELASLEGCTKSIEVPAINVTLVLIPCMIDSVEITFN